MTTIYVGNLPFNATEQDVRALFEPHGAVDSVKLINDRETGKPRASGSWTWRRLMRRPRFRH